MSNTVWIWSPDHKRHYRTEFRQDLKKWETIWEKVGEQAQAHPHTASNHITNSGPLSRTDLFQSASSYAATPRNASYAITAPSGHQGYSTSPETSNYHTQPTALPHGQGQYSTYGTQPSTHAARPNPTHATSLPYQYADFANRAHPTPSYNAPQPGLAAQHQYPTTHRSDYTSSETNPALIPTSVPSRGKGLTVEGSWGRGGKHYEDLDQSYYVKNKEFFKEGKVFAVLFTEPAGATVTAYNTSISTVRYNQLVHTQIRRFIVVRARTEFCFACPIFTYNGQGTLKRGVRPEEHAIAHSSTTQAVYLANESGMRMLPICVINAPGIMPLDPASRIYFGIHHPIQYNVKVQHVGDVHPEHVVNLRRYWNQMNQEGSNQAQEVTAAAQSNDDEEEEEEEEEEEDEDDEEDENDEEDEEPVVR